jgi:hypothetical protein
MNPWAGAILDLPSSNLPQCDFRLTGIRCKFARHFPVAFPNIHQDDMRRA